MSTLPIPRAQSVIVNEKGIPTREWYSYLIQLRDGGGLTPAQQEQLNNLVARVKVLEEAGQDLIITGDGSISVNGSAANLVIQITLVGDAESVNPTWYYGTGPDGSKGFFPVADAIAVSVDELEKLVGADGVITLGLADIPDAGGGALKKIMRDSFGRVAGTSDPTTTDLPEGSNLYYTDARVDARIAAAGGLQIGEILVADGISPPVMLTDEAETDFLYQG